MKRFLLTLALLISLSALAYGNSYYTHGSFPATGAQASSAAMRGEFDLITAGFDKLPTLSGNGGLPLVINSAGTAITTTGNLSLEKKWFAAAGCNGSTPGTVWDLPVSTPAVAACVTGTNIQKGVLQFPDTSGGFSAQNTYLMPSFFNASGAIDARIIWRTSATSGNAKFSLSTICTAVSATETDDPAFNTASTVTTAAPGTTLRLQTSAIDGVTATGCAAGELLHFKLFRDGNDGSDTISASLDVIGVELTFRKSMS